jgi:hypothetical protein
MRSLTGAWSALGLMLALSLVACGGGPTEADRDPANVERASPSLSAHALDETASALAEDGGDPGLAEVAPGPRPMAGVFDVGVIPSSGVGCPAGSDEIMIRMDDEDDSNGSSRSGYIGKTNFHENAWDTRFWFCRVDGALFHPFSQAASAADQRDDYAVLKLGTTCPADSQEFSRTYDNEDSGNGNTRSGVIAPNISNSNTKLFFCLFRYSSSGAVQSAFPALGVGFQYGVFGPEDFNRGALAFGRFRSDDEDDGNTNQFSAPSDALTAARRIIEPDARVSHGATIHHVIRAR